MVNNLSWLIYLADVVGSLNRFLALSSVGAILAIPVWSLRNQWLEDFRSGVGKVAVPFRNLLITSFSCALAASIIPSSTTIYAIAASEMGEEVIKSETAGKAMKALDAWLDRQIAPEKAESDPS